MFLWQESHSVLIVVIFEDRQKYRQLLFKRDVLLSCELVAAPGVNFRHSRIKLRCRQSARIGIYSR
jgi:hypothetical protein